MNKKIINKKNTLIFSIALSAVFLDQSAKFLIRKNFLLNESMPVIKNILHLTYVTNTGTAFSMFQNINWFFTLFSFIVIFVILHFIRQIKESEKWKQFAVGLLLGGTLGNLADRLIYGHVTDFIDFQVFPVFNVADSSITISVTILIILLWREK